MVSGAVLIAANKKRSLSKYDLLISLDPCASSSHTQRHCERHERSRGIGDAAESLPPSRPGRFGLP